MPHGRERDDANGSGSESSYECLRCGEIVDSTSHPGVCECGGEFHKRGNPRE